MRYLLSTFFYTQGRLLETQTSSADLIRVERFFCFKNNFFSLTDEKEIKQRARKVAIWHRKLKERYNKVDLNL